MLAHRGQSKSQTTMQRACSLRHSLIRCSKSVPIRVSDMSAEGATYRRLRVTYDP